jgi:polyisoprenyl-teichoic acid--peptidoglycan teichoic acid transferase
MGVFRLNKVGIFLGLIVLFLLGFSLGIFIGKKTINDSKNQDNNIFSFLFDNKNKELFKKDYVKVFGTKKIVFLILGSDYNWTSDHKPTSEKARTDTIILATLDIYNNELRLLSIPRDLRVYYDEPYNYYDKINAANAIEGPRLTKKIISNLFNIHIDYIILIKQKAIKELVDSIGGVYINVEKDMNYNDNWGNLHINLKKGYQLLNGDQVIGYMRFRMDEEGDLGRIRRQQQAIKEILSQLKDKINISNLYVIIDKVLPYVQTDLNKQNIINLVDYLKNNSIKMKTYTLPVATNDIEGISYVELAGDYEKAIEAFYKGYPTISVFNGTDYDNYILNKLNDYYYLDKRFYIIKSDYADDYYNQTIIITADKSKDSKLYYVIPVCKVFNVQEFIYNKYYNTMSDIYLVNKNLYEQSKDLLLNAINKSDEVLILGNDMKDYLK